VRVVVVAFAFSLSVRRSASSDPMTLDFSWRGAQGCITLFPNPEIRLRNIPTGAKSLSLTLTQGPREPGGQHFPIPGRHFVIWGYPDIWSEQSRLIPMDCPGEIIDRTGLIGSTSGAVLSHQRVGAGEALTRHGWS